jgi:hypothetical protein
MVFHHDFAEYKPDLDLDLARKVKGFFKKNNSNLQLAKNVVADIQQYVQVNPKTNSNSKQSAKTQRQQFNQMKNKKYFKAENQKAYGSQFQTLVGQIKTTSRQDSYIKVFFNKYLELARQKNLPNNPKYSKLPKNKEYQQFATKLGCEFASTKFIGGFINFVKKGKTSLWQNTKSKKRLFASLQAGSIGKFFQNPTFGDILGFYLDFHQTSNGLSQIRGLERLQSFCIVDQSRRVFQFAFKIEDESEESMESILAQVEKKG